MTNTSALTTDDRVSIMDLLPGHARCLDSGDLEGYVNNFAPNGGLFGKSRRSRALTRLAP
jgi:hypothetical protein